MVIAFVKKGGEKIIRQKTTTECLRGKFVGKQYYIHALTFTIQLFKLKQNIFSQATFRCLHHA